MLDHTLALVNRAEELAGSDGPLVNVLDTLRGLAMEEFGELLLSMRNPDYPNLSSRLPAMASDQIQKTWTGAIGLTLLRQTASFVRQLECNYAAVHGQGLRGRTILDFGCGYGRIMRLMYYFTDPDRLWGVDAWDESLATCEEAGMLGNFRLSERIPSSLPVEGTTFDLAYALSIFTHLSPKSADACLNAVRGSMKPGGLFVATVRPIEYWPFHDNNRGTSVAQEMVEQHRSEGFAYVAHGGAKGETYGDASISLDYFAQRPEWKLLGHDWSRIDPYQVSVLLQAV